MDREIKKIASLLSADASDYKTVIKDLEQKGFDGFHFDVMDGHFVKNFAFNAWTIKSLRKLTDLPFDVHLEIDNAGEYLDMFIDAGADMITIHPQTFKKPAAHLRYLRARNLLSSISLDPDISLKEIEGLLPLADNVIVMSVYPGFGSQKFIKESLNKVSDLKGIIISKGLDTKISVDGCINADTENEVIKAGADILIYGSSIFR